MCVSRSGAALLFAPKCSFQQMCMHVATTGIDHQYIYQTMEHMQKHVSDLLGLYIQLGGDGEDFNDLSFNLVIKSKILQFHFFDRM